MPYKYIGRTTDFKGKTLWEILGNLKNFGVGRIVVRNRFQRYPEPTYIKIMKVEALPNPEKPTYDDHRKVIVLAEKTFRGIKQDKLVQLEAATYKTDYILISKHKEVEFCKSIKTAATRILPDKMEFPPLVKEYILRQMKANGTPITEVPKMKILYNKTGVKMYRVAEDNEIPTEPEPTWGIGKSYAPRLYENIKE